MPAAIVVDKVSKKFLIGTARYSSLRDVIARPVRRLLGRAEPSETERTREFWALKDVSFEVEKGATLGLIGPNGAGKSTLLKLISRVSKPTEGTITTHGRVSALIEVGAGFHADLTGRENIYLNGSILGMTKREIDRKFDAIVDFSGIEQFIDTPVKYYSNGMYARLGFSVAVHVDPEVLLVDEVLSVGDWRFQQKCVDRMERVVAGGATVFFVSHNMQAVSSVCQHVIVLNEGKIMYQGETGEGISKYQQMLSQVTSGLLAATQERVQQRVEFLSCELRNAAGRTTGSLRTGDFFVLRVGLRFLSYHDEPVLILQIKNERGVSVFRVDTKAIGCRLGSLCEQQLATVEFTGRMNLLAGVYSLRGIVESRDHEQELASNDNLCAFAVLDNGGATGIANLDVSANVSKQDTASDDSQGGGRKEEANHAP